MASLQTLTKNPQSIHDKYEVFDQEDLDTDTEFDGVDENPELPMSITIASSHYSMRRCFSTKKMVPYWRFSVFGGVDGKFQGGVSEKCSIGASLIILFPKIFCTTLRWISANLRSLGPAMGHS